MTKRANQMKTLVACLLLCVFSCKDAISQTTLKIADVLQSNMVLQQKKQFKIWGTAKPESVVIIESDWSKKLQVKALENGEFTAKIKVPAAIKGDFTQHKISIKSDGQTTVLENLLIGVNLWISRYGA